MIIKFPEWAMHQSERDRLSNAARTLDAWRPRRHICWDHPHMPLLCESLNKLTRNHDPEIRRQAEALLAEIEQWCSDPAREILARP